MIKIDTCEILLTELRSKYQSELKIWIQVSNNVRNHSLDIRCGGSWTVKKKDFKILLGNK